MEGENFQSLAELADNETLKQTQEIVATCPSSSFGKESCDYTRTGILTCCLFCEEAYKTNLIGRTIIKSY